MNEATLAALVGVVFGSVGTGLFNLLLQSKQFNHNKEMYLLQNKGPEIKQVSKP